MSMGGHASLWNLPNKFAVFEEMQGLFHAIGGLALHRFEGIETVMRSANHVFIGKKGFESGRECGLPFIARSECRCDKILVFVYVESNASEMTFFKQFQKDGGRGALAPGNIYKNHAARSLFQ